MKAFWLLLFAVCCHAKLIAQNTSTVAIPAGTKIMDVLAITEVLYYPQFTPGKVFLKDGTTADARLNYNCLFDEIHFINPKGDTLALADEKNIKFIVVDRDTFYYDQGYLRVLAGTGVAKLALKQAWSVQEGRLNASFNTSSTTSAITSYTAYNTAGSRYGLVVNEDVGLTKKDHYYFGNKFNRFLPAGKKSLLLLFPKQERQIETYLKENKIDFGQREDLEKIIAFVTQL